jgi:hypothetical protein
MDRDKGEAGEERVIPRHLSDDDTECPGRARRRGKSSKGI